MDKDQKLITVAELSQRLDIGQPKIRLMVRNGELPHLRVGKQPRFFWDEVVAALRHGQIGQCPSLSHYVEHDQPADADRVRTDSVQQRR